MGTVIERKTADGSSTFRGEIILRRDKKIVHRESRSFPKEKDARDWVTSREKQLKKPGALDILIARKVEKITVRQLIARYIAANNAAMGKTKLNCLEAISDYDIADIPCEDLRSADVVALAQALHAGDRKPQTVQNYLSHLTSVLRIARSAWNIPIDRHLGEDAMLACKALHLVSKSAQRTRRPTEAELDRLMRHFIERTNRGRAAPMELITAYAIFSTRRQEEICQITWSDFDAETQTQMVRDMKHPGQKIGNDVRCAVPDNALRVMQLMPKREGEDRIFGFTTDAISKAFTEACKFLSISDLHFHDLRHEGISWLFEQGLTIPQAATVSGHKSWTSLQRYTQIRQAGDRYANWKWWPALENWEVRGARPMPE